MGSEKVKNESRGSLLEADSLAFVFQTTHKQLSHNAVNTKTRPLCDHNKVGQRRTLWNNRSDSKAPSAS